MRKKNNTFLQTVHMFGMLIYIFFSFLFGLVLRFSRGEELLLSTKRGFQAVLKKQQKRRIRDEIEATTHKHTAVNFPHFIPSVKGILKGIKGLFS